MCLGLNDDWQLLRSQTPGGARHATIGQFRGSGHPKRLDGNHELLFKVWRMLGMGKKDAPGRHLQAGERMACRPGAIDQEAPIRSPRTDGRQPGEACVAGVRKKQSGGNATKAVDVRIRRSWRHQERLSVESPIRIRYTDGHFSGLGLESF